MARKKWTKNDADSPSLHLLREKRKWQIAFRRYVLEKNKSVGYAACFGLGIDQLRKWIEIQFIEGQDWTTFGKTWQFSHIMPLSFFDFSDHNDLLLCWNFTNIKVEALRQDAESTDRQSLFLAKKYFLALAEGSGLAICHKMLQRIQSIEENQRVVPTAQIQFLNDNIALLKEIEGYSAFEFELLNAGVQPSAIVKETAFLKKFDK